MPAQALRHVVQRLDDAARAAGTPAPRLLAVSKTRAVGEIATLAEAMQRLVPPVPPAFGENYVQEAAAKVAQLTRQGIEWHLVGHLQSNKAAQAASLFDWVQTVDRAKLVGLLAMHRPEVLAPLNVLLQVNIDDQDSKHGCTPASVDALADQVAAQPRLVLRGLMAIPAPPHAGAVPDPAPFVAMRALFERLQVRHPQVDTLSMGMSGDLEAAIAAGATLVRVGTALFGPRATATPASPPVPVEST